MQQLGYGVIGLGMVSERHLDAAETIAGARLVAIADQNVEKAEGVSAARASRPTVYGDYQDLLADDDVDVVVVAVPTQFHAQVAIAAAGAGKHIYCEKAMAPTLQECRAMIAAADHNGIKLTIGQSTRFQAHFVQARRVIEAGHIGDIIAVDGAFPQSAATPDKVRDDFWRFKAGAQGHGFVVNFGCHYIDTARYLCDRDPQQVTAWIANRFSHGQTPEDQFIVTAICHDQTAITIAMYSAPTYTPSRTNGFLIYGTEGILEAYYRGDGVALKRGSEDLQPIELDEDLKAEETWRRFHRQFRECIEQDTPPPITGRDGMLNVEWALAAYLANERRAWMDLPLGPEFYEYGGPRLDESLPVPEA